MVTRNQDQFRFVTLPRLGESVTLTWGGTDYPVNALVEPLPADDVGASDGQHTVQMVNFQFATVEIGNPTATDLMNSTVVYNGDTYTIQREVENHQFFNSVTVEAVYSGTIERSRESYRRNVE